MRRTWTKTCWLVLLAFSFMGTAPVEAQRGPLAEHVVALAIAGDSEALSELRRGGQAAVNGLRARRKFVQEELGRASTPEEYRRGQAKLTRLDELIDHVGGARYCSESGLFWHTDGEAALAESRATGKPVLRLAMLGKLTEEFSCANSRFFRTTLYADPSIADQLREQFVLHWTSVRPVPQVTVDFGDGRVVRRTVTGNSAHYILGSDGRPLDVLPGLHAPVAFNAWLDKSRRLSAAYNALPAAERHAFLQEHHRAALASLEQKRLNDLRAVKMDFLVEVVAPIGPQSGKPNAAAAARRAQPKFLTEVKLVADLRRPTPWTDPEFRQSWLEAAAKAIAARHPELSVLSDASVRIMQRENPGAARAGKQTFTKRREERRTLAFVDGYRRSLAADTIYNEYELHRQAHRWFLEASAPWEFAALNDRVYAQLFLTPKDDPWLGLAGEDVYTGLRDGGRADRPPTDRSNR